MPVEPVTAAVEDFSRANGLPAASVYKLLDEGEIASVRIGRRRLVVLQSYREMIARRLDSAGGN